NAPVKPSTAARREQIAATGADFVDGSWITSSTASMPNCSTCLLMRSGGWRPQTLLLFAASRLLRAWDRFRWAGIGGFQPHLGQFRLVEPTAYINQTMTNGRICRSRDG